MTDGLDVELQDQELENEIQLVAELMVAAGQSDDPLSQEAVDAILTRLG
jgi:hypothetical protein